MKRLIEKFKELDYYKQKDLLNELRDNMMNTRPFLSHCKEVESCPHCSSKRLHIHGKYRNGGTRYKCVKCKKTFNELTGTSIHKIHKKHLLSRFIELMFESKSLRFIRDELGLALSTVLDWRHRILLSFNELFTKHFKGIVETDNVFFRFNQKGRRKNFINVKKQRGVSKKQVTVMVTMDRYNTIDMKVVKRGNIDLKGIKRVLNEERFNTENIICSDENKSIINYFKEMGLVHKTFNTNKGQHVHPTEKIYHVQNLNCFVGDLKCWISENFKSVSTKYLHLYLNWFMLFKILKNDQNCDNYWWNLMLSMNDSFDKRIDFEKEYQLLLSR